MKILKKLIPKSIKKKLKRKMLLSIKNDLKDTEVDYKVYISDSKKYQNRVAIITGGSGAFGSAIGFKLAMEGANVIIASRVSKKCNKVVKYIKDHGGKAETLKLDVTDYNDIKTKFKSVYDKYKRIDILINCAGKSTNENAAYLEKQSIDVINEILTVNVNGTIFCSKEVIGYMKKNNYGRIINIGSSCGENGLSKYSEYSTSKAGIIGFTKALSKEVAKDNITVNCISPGIIRNIMWDKNLDNFPTNKTWVGYIGSPEDVANAVEFFCREESNYIIGQNLVVDGGRGIGLKGE